MGCYKPVLSDSSQLFPDSLTPWPQAMPTSPDRRTTRRRFTAAAASGWAVFAALLLGSLAPEAAAGPALEDGHDAATVSWVVTESDTAPRLVMHGRTADAARRGAAGERLVIEASAGTSLRIQSAFGPAAAIDELTAAVWLRCNRPDVQFAARVVLPRFISQKTGRPVEFLVPGTVSRDVDRWERLQVGDIPDTVARRMPALRLEHGNTGDATGAQVTALVLELYSGPGRYEVSLDDLSVAGFVPPPDVHADPAVRLAAAEGAAAAPTGAATVDPPTGLARGVLEVAGLPFFPRSIDHSGEPLTALATLGFNCVRLPAPASSELLDEARAAGLWVICPPPAIPDVDIRDPGALPSLRNWDRVLIWDMGTGLSEPDVETLAERARRVRACDPRAGRPLIAAADSGLRSISRHVDMLVARRTVLGTSLELIDYLSWLRERPRLARPGTPLLATLSTEIDPQVARQAAALSGIGGRGLAVDPESLSLAALSAVAAGTRGILFSSSRRIDGDDHEARMRAAAAREMNLRLRLLEPWAAAGRFAATAQTSDREVQAVVMEAARARMVVAWRCVQGSQICARRYDGALPRDDAAVTLLIPGVPEAHQAWEVTPGGLRPLTPRRVTGGVAVTLDHFTSQALVLISGEPAVTAHVQGQLRELLPMELASARSLAALTLADDAALLARLPPAALGNLPVAAMLGTARQDAVEAEGLAAADPAAAIAKLRRCIAVCGQFERLAWERGVQGTGSLLSLMASPLATSDATLAEQWRFTEALGAAIPGPQLVAGGGMDQIEELASSGWRHFAHAQGDVATSVEVSRQRPFAGSGSLRMIAKAADEAETPAVIETPPVWITTPPVAAPAGKLVEISARIFVPSPIRGSVDGLFIFDSLGGPALGERVGATRDWAHVVLYRIVPADADETPLTVTFALTGLGEAAIDEVTVRTMERPSAGGVPVTAVSASPGQQPTSRFPSPTDLLSPAPTSPPVAAAVPEPRPSSQPAVATPQWPGMDLAWPKLLPFSQSADEPPPGPGGGTVDPFKRARTVVPPAP